MAVANALPTLKAEADRVSRYDNGRAVLELIDDLTGHDLRETPPRVPRREILLGTRADGTRVRMPAAWFNVLVASPAVNGRSTLPAGMLERLAAEGYQFCAIDTTGDYDAMPDAIVLGAARRAPAPADVITALHKPDANVFIDVGRMSRQAGRRSSGSCSAPSWRCAWPSVGGIGSCSTSWSSYCPMARTRCPTW